MSYLPDNACPLCKEMYPIKPKEFGSDVQCAFLTGKFSHKNWQCGTMIRLRDLSADDHGYAKHRWNMDENATVLPDGEGNFLFITWYKRRGGTQDCHFYNMENQVFEECTLERAKAAIDYNGAAA